MSALALVGSVLGTTTGWGEDVPGSVGDVWQQITTPQPAPTSQTVWLTGLVLLVALSVPGVWHLLRHGLTIVHEAGHAAVAVLVGRRLTGIRVHSDTSGLTVSRGRSTGPGMVATAAAGYPAPAVLGLAAAWLLSRGYAVGVLWMLLVVLVLVLLQIRNWYGLWSVLVAGAVVGVVTVLAPSSVQQVVAAAITWFLLLGAPRAVLELQAQRARVRRRGGRDSSDAGLLAGLTHVPAVVWVGVLLVLCTGALVLGGAWLLAVWAA